MGSQRLGSKGIELRDVSFSWPSGAEVLSPLSLALEPGDRIGIVGPNGAGKTTLLDLVAGRLTPTRGTVERGATVKIGYHDQLGRDLDPDQRVREAVAGDKGKPSPEDVTLMRRFWFDGDAQFAPIRLLSGGERRRLQLLLTLVAQPNVLLLDEPTNDLDLDTLRALEDLLDDWPGIVVAVSHDRAFLDRTADQLLAFDGDGGVRLVRGGVAGWMAERARSATSAPPSQALRSTSRVTAPKPAPARSASTLRRLLKDAEKGLAAATRKRDALAAEITGVTDHRELTALGERLTAAQTKVDAAEELWLELAEECERAGL
jgi:ATP-binding cassette subfamily F protein uup